MVILSSVGTFTRQVIAAPLEGPASEPHVFFSHHEYLLLGAIAERIVGDVRESPGAAGPIDVAARADRFLSTADPEIQEQIHLLLTVFNSPLFTLLFDMQFSSFLAMAPESKDAYLEGWMMSHLEFRRTSFQALKRLCLSMYYSDHASWEGIGYTGMFLPEDR